ncbi:MULTISPECIES: hypothetical protein [Yersinia]|uniref:hypothetical protein n=1 Tax=Yersinia TaxID=629 RepID=UPI001643E7CA|nr:MULTISPECIES: hypothetical protein [Yersinia]MDA5542751.1 hypothetical protein [Yersinia rochesterensis]UZM76615.1 hypothetical protein OP863_08385 [Yersinia sp. SCPM-O-B-9106 (C-191)]
MDTSTNFMHVIRSLVTYRLLQTASETFIMAGTGKIDCGSAAPAKIGKETKNMIKKLLIAATYINSFKG